jgi:transcription elongation factor Elf1
MPDAYPRLSDSASLCTAHECPNCGVAEHVTVERVVVATTVVTLCHCRTCGHSWHPQIESEIA